MTSLNELANKYQTDKGDKHFEAHGYAEVYDKLFTPLRHNPIRLLEIGIKDIHFPGASIKMWDEYFTNPYFRFYGFDILDCVEYENERIKTFIVDQNNPSEIEKAVGETTFDIIIDDAAHLSYGQLISFMKLYPLLNEGGLYIIEDLHINDGYKTIKWFKERGHNFKLFNDDKLIVIYNE